jgi:hypothetical protein
MIPEISESIRDMFEFKEEYIKLFEVLSDSDVLKSIFYLLSIQTNAFTTKLFEKKFKFSTEKSQEIINKLKSLGMIESVNTELDGEIKESSKFIYGVRLKNIWLMWLICSFSLFAKTKKNEPKRKKRKFFYSFMVSFAIFRFFFVLLFSFRKEKSNKSFVIFYKAFAGNVTDCCHIINGIILIIR